MRWFKTPKGTPLAKRLELHSRHDPKTGCRLWCGQTVKGYGRTKVNGRKVLAHRAAWELENGPIPADLFVLHRCDTPSCINVDHLFLGDAYANMQDMARKGRGRWPDNRGERSGQAKLTTQAVIAIRRDRRRYRDIANDYGVTAATICRARSGEAWGHIK